MKIASFSLALFVSAFSFSLSPVHAEEQKTLELFYGAECPHCHKERVWLEDVKNQHPDLQIIEYEVWHNVKNAKYWAERMKEYDLDPRGVPTNIIGDQVIVGFKEQEIVRALGISDSAESDSSNTKTEEPMEESQAFWEKYLSYSWPVMAFVLGIIDGFNPCAMWSLMILLGFLITMENKARRWLIGGVFLAASGILYGGALLAYLFGFTQITYLLSGGVMPWLFRGVGTLAIIAALFSFYAFYKNKVECEIRNPDEKRKFHKKLSDLLKKEELLLILPGLILLAFSVNAVELLCSFAIPTAFVATIVQMDLSLTAQLTAVAIYDLAYMLDDLIVFLIAMFTLSFAMISPKIVRISHLIGGIILLILGYLLLFHPSVLSLISKGIN
jgi:MFS family permease/glutaredoxin